MINCISRVFCMKSFQEKVNGFTSYFSLFQKKISRDDRIMSDPGVVQGKLKKEFDIAQAQKENEVDNPKFSYKACKDSKFHGESHLVGKYSVGVCHAQGRRPTMEDAHLATSFNLVIKDKSYPIELFGVFDGHGGDKAALFVSKHLEKELQKALLEFNPDSLSDEGIWNALKMTTVRLSESFKRRGDGSGTTATIALMLDGKLWTANVGDSRTILENKGKAIFQLSEDAEPNDPRYKKSIEKRGGKVINIWGVHRINGNLAVGRAIGDAAVGKGMTARPKITMMPLSEIQPGSHLILACDGIYDVASTRQIGKAAAQNKEPAGSFAKGIVYSAYQANSSDNLSALVVQFPGFKQNKDPSLFENVQNIFWNLFAAS